MNHQTRLKTVSALRATARILNAGLVPSVNSFLHILLAHLTQYDMKLSAKDGNIYRLGHLLGAANKVAKDMEGKLESSSPEDLEALKAAMGQRFTEGFRPVEKTIKAIDAFLTNGTAPKYPIPKGAAPKAT